MEYLSNVQDWHIALGVAVVVIGFIVYRKKTKKTTSGPDYTPPRPGNNERK